MNKKNNEIQEVFHEEKPVIEEQPENEIIAPEIIVPEEIVIPEEIVVEEKKIDEEKIDEEKNEKTNEANLSDEVHRFFKKFHTYLANKYQSMKTKKISPKKILLPFLVA
jgi:hypothetical protein